MGGNIGYAVDDAYRGTDTTLKACRLVFDVARAHRMPYVIVSCAAANGASRKTLENLGGELLEKRVPPIYSALYRSGEQSEHCIFLFSTIEKIKKAALFSEGRFFILRNFYYKIIFAEIRERIDIQREITRRLR